MAMLSSEVIIVAVFLSLLKNFATLLITALEQSLLHKSLYKQARHCKLQIQQLCIINEYAKEQNKIETDA